MAEFIMEPNPSATSTIKLPAFFLYDNPAYRLAKQDPIAFRTAALELKRQVFGLEMIASENYCSEAVLAAAGTVLTNKYAEGLPRDRYYGGCEHIDVAENLAIERAKTIFRAKHANVQPNSGTQANQAVFYALMNPRHIGKKGKILSLHLDHGGHLSHGAEVNAIGSIYDIVHYTVNHEGIIDYDEVLRIANKERPDVIVAGGSAYPREINFKRFREIADEVGAFSVADMAHFSGLVAAYKHQSPIDHMHVTTTTTQKTLGGPRGAMILLGKDYETMIPWVNGRKRRLFKAIDSAVFPGYQGGPLEHIIFAKAVAFGEILNRDQTGISQEFIARQQLTIDNAKVLATIFSDNGYELSSGGTDTHLILVRNPGGLSGLVAQYATEQIRITINKNKGPGDEKSAKIPSWIRIGTPAISTRGVTSEETRVIGESLVELFDKTSSDEKNNPITSKGVIDRLKPRIDEIVAAHPIYTNLLRQYEFVAQELGININN